MKRLMLCAFLIYAGSLTGQILKKEITLEKGERTTKEILKQVEEKGQINFSYLPAHIDLGKKIQIKGGKKPIDEILTQVFKETDVVFEQIGSVVVLRKKQTPQKPESNNSTLLLFGEVSDQKTGEPLPFTTIRIGQTNKGFISNEDGAFQIILDPIFLSDSLIFSFIGYHNFTIPISAFTKKPLHIKLTESVKMLESVEINPIDPLEVLKTTISKITQNHHSETVYLNAYYRELIKVDTSFVKFADAACQVFYTGHSTTPDKLSGRYSQFSPDRRSIGFPGILNRSHRENDQVRIIESRASNNLQVVNNSYVNFDFEQFDIMGGPLSLLGTDYAKIPIRFLSLEKLAYHTYELEEITTYNNRNVYVISFEPKKKNLSKSFQKGKIFIDVETSALTAFEFEVPESHQPIVDKKIGWIKFIAQLPKKMRNELGGERTFRRKMTDYNHRVKVDYREHEGKWYLSTIKRKSYYRNHGDILDDMHFEAITEFIVNDIETENVVPFATNEQFDGFLYYYPTTYNKQFWKSYNALVPTGAFGQALEDLEKEKSLDQQFLEMVTKDTSLTPPVAQKKKHFTTIHDVTLEDDYFWLRNRETPEVDEYLKKENAYTNNYMIPLKKSQRNLYHEMVNRVEKNSTSIPSRIDNYYYYSKYTDSLEYPIILRKRDSLAAQEELVLDINSLSEGHEFYGFGSEGPDPKHQIFAYTENLTGGGKSTLRFHGLSSKITDSLQRVSSMEWLPDGKRFLYVEKDKSNRAYRVYIHTLGTPQAQDQLLYEEQDPSFSIGLNTSKSKEYIFIVSSSSDENEVYLLHSNSPEKGIRLISPRSKGIQYYPEHAANSFYILSNKNSPNYQLLKTKNLQELDSWETIIPHSPDVMLMGFEVFTNFLVINEIENAETRLRVIDLINMKSHTIKFDNEVHNAGLGYSPDTESQTVRIWHATPLLPSTTYDYHMVTRKKEIVKQRKVQGNYDPSKYVTERIFAPSHDGKEIPITLVYRKGANKRSNAKRNGKKIYRERKLYLTGYGAYGISSEPFFSYDLPSLLDRNFIFAIAHVRGGNEMGQHWYEEGKLLSKKNTFRDFISVSEHLITEDYVEKGNIVASGGSAGGLLVGAVVNESPDLFKAAILHVPFLDVVNTMLDEDLPLTAGEYKEWGNPNDPAYFDYMRSYAPYENIKKQAYPNMLFTCSVNDENVPYWEAVKTVAKLRSVKTDTNEILLKINSIGGHGGGSRRFDGFQELALEYAFIIDLFSN